MEDTLNTPTINEEQSFDKKEVKKIQTSYLLFLLATIFLAVSRISLATNINGVPQIVALLSIFQLVSYVIYFITVFRVRNVNKSFFYSLLAFSFFILISYIHNLCESSNSGFDHYIGKALGWSESFINCLFYLYFFNGTRLLFEKNGFAKHGKTVKIYLAVFSSIFILTEIFEYFSTTRMVRTNRFANRFFLYGFWGMQFIMYLFIFIVALMTYIYAIKQRKLKEKEGDRNNG